MKKSKIGKLAALLAAGSLLFGGFFMSCSSDGDSGSNSNETEDSDDSGNTGGGVHLTRTHHQLRFIATEHRQMQTFQTAFLQILTMTSKRFLFTALAAAQPR